MLRAVWGALQWKVTQTGPQFASSLSELQARVKDATLKLVKDTNNLVHFVKANGSSSPIDIALPFTVGTWDQTEPVEITLKKGQNVLSFSRDHEGLKGLTIRDLALTPVK